MEFGIDALQVILSMQPEVEGVNGFPGVKDAGGGKFAGLPRFVDIGCLHPVEVTTEVIDGDVGDGFITDDEEKTFYAPFILGEGAGAVSFGFTSE